MIRSGTIQLWDKGDVLIVERKYYFPQNRKEVIKKWRSIYTIVYNRGYLQICPDTDEKRVNTDGTNKKKYEKQKL